MPRLFKLMKVLRRRARRTPIRQWRLHALTYVLAAAAGGLIVTLGDLPRGYWVTLAVFTTLQMDLQRSLVRALQAGIGIFGAAAVLIYMGHSLADPPIMVMIMLPLVMLSRAFQAHHYGLFVLQTTLSFVLLAETLAQDWELPQLRLINAAIGVSVALAVTLMMYLLRRLIARIALRESDQTAATDQDKNDSIMP
jgi:uncharacterized membrane protein YccC